MGLDLAGLLHVLDQNWYQISSSLDLTSEARHFVKEMQTVRNRWAHADTEGFPADDIYRDLDTLQRFAVVIEADHKLIRGQMASGGANPLWPGPAFPV
ncbi:MAG: Swt1 family HEPN domain-containing protein [Deltaproteobacteria bacterium]|nr:Swt1 family HEPN domain-containing protein [Deltaproteobacteria bacterium]